jgi:hypothetical protein
MPTSKEKRESNRLNSLKSTGPKTQEGKDRSKANSYKHGLTGAGVVLPPEEAAEVDALADTLVAEMNPGCTLGRILLRQTALYAVRVDRAAASQSACTALLVRHAVEQFDDLLQAAPEAELEQLTAHPATAARRLHQSIPGLRLVVRCWQGLLDDLAVPGRWQYLHWERVENLMGRRPHEIPRSRLGGLARAVLGDFSDLGPDDGAGLDGPERRAWAAERLTGLIAARVVELEGRLARCDTAALEQDRAEAAQRALFDPSPEAALARKYGGTNQRFLFRCLKEYREVEAAAAAARKAAEAEAEARKAAAEAEAAARKAAAEAEAQAGGARKVDGKTNEGTISDKLASFFPAHVPVAPAPSAGPPGSPVRWVTGPPEAPGTVCGGRFCASQPPG